jgi:hypothetical protein
LDLVAVRKLRSVVARIDRKNLTQNGRWDATPRLDWRARDLIASNCVGGWVLQCDRFRLFKGKWLTVGVETASEGRVELLLLDGDLASRRKFRLLIVARRLRFRGRILRRDAEWRSAGQNPRVLFVFGALTGQFAGE